MRTFRLALKPTRVSHKRERTLSSWSSNTITAAHGKDVTLEIRQQFMAPPGRATTDSTGRHIWPSAKPLLQYMLSIDQKEAVKNNERRNKTVLELGSGCGLVGMGLVVATISTEDFLSSTCGDDTSSSLSPTYRVVMTDHSTAWLEQNVARNQEALSGNRNKAKHPNFSKNIAKA